MFVVKRSLSRDCNHEGAGRVRVVLTPFAEKICKRSELDNDCVGGGGCDTTVVRWENAFRTFGDVKCAETEVNVVDGPEELATVMSKSLEELDRSLTVKDIADGSSLDSVTVRSYTSPLNRRAPSDVHGDKRPVEVEVSLRTT